MDRPPFNNLDMRPPATLPPPVPKEPTGNITLEEYLAKTCPNPKPNEADSLEMKKNILNIIRIFPVYWEPRSNATLDQWRELGIHIHSRFNKFVSVPQIRRLVMKAQVFTKQKLRQYYLSDRFPEIVVRALLSRWNLYAHFDYYHEALKPYETDLFERMQRLGPQKMSLEKYKLVEKIIANQKKIEHGIQIGKCLLCKIPYGKKEKECAPRVLACGHIFCERCVRMMQKKEPRNHVRCFGCRGNTIMLGNHIEELPYSFDVQRRPKN